MKRIYSIIFLLLFVFPVFSYSQYAIKGKVVDGKTNQPLAFVSIFHRRVSDGFVCGFVALAVGFFSEDAGTTIGFTLDSKKD